MKCTSSYPASFFDLNLKTIKDMRKKFKCEIGYSDHSIGVTAATSSIHYGATFIEKHICLDKQKGIDSKFSLSISKLKNFNLDILNFYKRIGSVNYGCTKNEKPYLKFKRSIYSSKKIKKGDRFNEDNIKVVRPGYGLEPKFFKKIIGKTSKKYLLCYRNKMGIYQIKSMDKICIIGLGYVGLPILMNLSKTYRCIGYDNKSSRIKELNKGIDIFNEYKINDIRNKNLKVTNKKFFNEYNIFIITVPTPIKKNKDPDLSHLKDVCLNLSSRIKKMILLYLSLLFIQD